MWQTLKICLYFIPFGNKRLCQLSIHVLSLLAVRVKVTPWLLTDLQKTDPVSMKDALQLKTNRQPKHTRMFLKINKETKKIIARVLSLKSTVSPSHSISQSRDLHEWFYSQPAIILPSLSSSAFLNMHALHFPTTFQIQMDVPCSRLCSLLPLPLFLLLLSATLLYLWLTQFPGLIHPAVL